MWNCLATSGLTFDVVAVCRNSDGIYGELHASFEKQPTLTRLIKRYIPINESSLAADTLSHCHPVILKSHLNVKSVPFVDHLKCNVALFGT